MSYRTWNARTMFVCNLCFQVRSPTGTHHFTDRDLQGGTMTYSKHNTRRAIATALMLAYAFFGVWKNNRLSSEIKSASATSCMECTFFNYPERLPTNTFLFFFNAGLRPHQNPHTFEQISKYHLVHAQSSMDKPFTVVPFQPDGAVAISPTNDLDPYSQYMFMSDSSPQEKVLSFTTSGKPDHEDPEWDGIEEAEYNPAGRFCDKNSTYERCYGHDASVYIKLKKFSDDQVPNYDMLFGIWIAAPGKNIDYSKFALMVVQPGFDPETTPDRLRIRKRRSKGLFIGHIGCNCSFITSIYLAKYEGSFKLGIRAMDWAGNMSKPYEVTVIDEKVQDPQGTSHSNTRSSLAIHRHHGCGCSMAFDN
jgi:hypothetical protein